MCIKVQHHRSLFLCECFLCLRVCIYSCWTGKERNCNIFVRFGNAAWRQVKGGRARLVTKGVAALRTGMVGKCLFDAGNQNPVRCKSWIWHLRSLLAEVWMSSGAAWGVGTLGRVAERWRGRQVLGGDGGQLVAGVWRHNRCHLHSGTHLLCDSHTCARLSRWVTASTLSCYSINLASYSNSSVTRPEWPTSVWSCLGG